MYSIVKWSFLIIGGLVLLFSIAVAGVHFKVESTGRDIGRDCNSGYCRIEDKRSGRRAFPSHYSDSELIRRIAVVYQPTATRPGKMR